MEDRATQRYLFLQLRRIHVYAEQGYLVHILLFMIGFGSRRCSLHVVSLVVGKLNPQGSTATLEIAN